MSENQNIDPKEFEVAKKEAESSTDTYVHKLKKPLIYDDKTYTELTFEWDTLTGNDALSIEIEMQQLGKPLIVPTFSGEYLIRVAARACTVPIGSDAFLKMPIADYNRIRSAARSFLLKTEQ